LPGMPRQKYTPTRFIRQSRVALEARAAWWWWKYRGPGSLFVRHGHGERIRQKVQAAEELGTACRARKFPNRCRIPSRRARACHGAKYGCEGAMRELEPKWLRMVSSDLRIAPLRQSCLRGGFQNGAGHSQRGGGDVSPEVLRILLSTVGRSSRAVAPCRADAAPSPLESSPGGPNTQ
jgi:hypothetical protein